MRIISGQLKGRQFLSPNSYKTHPMSEKMRGALFAILGDVSGLSVFDAFAGSGALAFEALSRGAGSVLAVDNDRQAQQVIQENISQLGVSSKMRLVKAAVASWSSTSSDQTFDLIFCDPPYDKLQLSTLRQLAEHLQPGGTYVLSWPAQESLPELPGLKIIQNKNYGDAQLVFYQQTG